MVGQTEAQLTRDGVCYEVGVANYREVRAGATSLLTSARAPSGFPYREVALAGLFLSVSLPLTGKGPEGVESGG